MRRRRPWSRSSSCCDDAHADGRLVDVQWQTPHLASLGVVAVPRAEYLERLDVALTLPEPAAFRRDLEVAT